MAISIFLSGCYHSERTIVSLWSKRKSIKDLTIKKIIFSEPGKGKSAPDQVRNYFNENEKDQSFFKTSKYL